MEHVILRGRALAAVVQLAGRWLRSAIFISRSNVLGRHSGSRFNFFILEGFRFCYTGISIFFKENVSLMLYSCSDLRVFVCVCISPIFLRSCGLNFV